MKFYICNHCGNIIAYVKSSGVPVVCCGEKMQELVPNTTDAAVEKHVPVIQIDGAKVCHSRLCGAPHDSGTLHPVDCSCYQAGKSEKRAGGRTEAAGRVHAL